MIWFKTSFYEGFARNIDLKIVLCEHSVVCRDGFAFKGAGVLIQNASPRLVDCLIKENQSSGSGAGLFADNGGITFDNVIFSNNSSSFAGGGLWNGDGEVLDIIQLISSWGVCP
jgi:hypothetical protein